MDRIAALFVQRPANVLVVAAFFLLGYLAMRYTALGAGRRPSRLLLLAMVWALYAAWEWLVLWKTPEANIRVDLMVVWPLLIILSLWFGIRAFR